MATAETPSSGATERPQRSIRAVLGGLMIALLLAMLDNMIVGTAMPRIVGDLGGIDHLSWVVTAYTLATAASTPIWGKLGDLYGRKRTFMVSIVIFLIGSALAGLSASMFQLIAFRGVQGLGAGGLTVGVVAIIGDLVPPRERGKYQGMLAAIMAVAMIAGPLVGGTLTDHLGWRWSFYINLPLGALALFVVSATLHLPRKRVQARIDYIGAALLTVGITALVLITTWGGTQYAWGSGQILGLAAVAVAALTVFLRVERTAAEPIMPLGIFRNRNFSVVTLISFLVGLVMFGAMTFLPLYQQTVQGASATGSGLLLLPMMFALLAVSVLAGQVTSRTGKYRIFPIVGGALIAMGALLLSQLDTTTDRLTSSLMLLVFGAGLGFLMQITTLIAQNSVGMRDIGVATSTVTLFRTIGGSFGVSLAGAIFAHRLNGVMSSRLGADADQVTASDSQIDPSTLDRLPGQVRDAYLHGVAGGIHSIFLWGAAIAVIGFLAAWFVREVPLRDETPQPPADTSGPGGTERRGAAVDDGEPGGAQPGSGSGSGTGQDGRAPQRSEV